jgi:hypothetical protein
LEHVLRLAILSKQELSVTTETGTINWQRDVDAALADAQQTQRPVLLDFTAAPQ